MSSDTILVTVTGVHEDTGDRATVKIDAITHDAESRHVVCEVPANLGQPLSEMLAKGQDVHLTVLPGQIVPRTAMQVIDGPKTIDAFLAQHPNVEQKPTIDAKDQRIIDQIHAVANAVAQHEHIIATPTRGEDEEIYYYAKQRREAEAELNKLLMERVNGMVSKIRQAL